MIPIHPTTTVLDLLRAYPQTFPVLLGRGMCADCKADPPDVPLSHFASKHCGGDIDRLIEELRAVAKSGSDRADAGLDA